MEISYTYKHSRTEWFWCNVRSIAWRKAIDVATIEQTWPLNARDLAQEFIPIPQRTLSEFNQYEVIDLKPASLDNLHIGEGWMIHLKFGLRTRAEQLRAGLRDVVIDRSGRRRFSQRHANVQQSLFDELECNL